MTVMGEQTAFIDALYIGRRDSVVVSGLDEVQLGVEAGLERQLRVLERFTATGEQLGGWKVGLTSGRARDRMGVGFRPFGYILRSRIFDSGSVLPRANILNCRLEPELCLIVDVALSGQNVSVAEAKAAVRAVAPAFEINEIRLRTDTRPATLLADGLAQWGIVLGPPTAVRDDLIHTSVEFSRDGRLIETKTPGETMDDPYLSLSRLCRLLHTYGHGLKPGQPVITGSFCHHALTQAGTYRASFSDIGDVSVHFS